MVAQYLIAGKKSENGDHSLSIHISDRGLAITKNEFN